jgi:hypothetical protein
VFSSKEGVETLAPFESPIGKRSRRNQCCVAAVHNQESGEAGKELEPGSGLDFPQLTDIFQFLQLDISASTDLLPASVPYGQLAGGSTMRSRLGQH